MQSDDVSLMLGRGGGSEGKAIPGQQEGFLEEVALAWGRRGKGGPGWAWPESGCGAGKLAGLCRGAQQCGGRHEEGLYARLGFHSPRWVRAAVPTLHVRTRRPRSKFEPQGPDSWPTLFPPARWFLRSAAGVRAAGDGRFRGYRPGMSHRRGSGAKGQVPVPGGGGLGHQRTERLVVPSSGARLPGPGQVRGSWFRPAGPFPDLLSRSFPLPGELRQETGAAREGQPPREGEPPSQSPQDSNFVGQEDASWSLGRKRETRSPGVAAKPKVRSPGDAVGGARSAHMEPRHLPNRAPLPRSLSSPSCVFPPGPSGDRPGSLQPSAAWAPGSHQPLPSACRETQEWEVQGLG